MTHIHYKFSSKLGYNTLIFDGPNITLKDLKIQIMEKEKLRAGFCDLQITDAQSNQEYIDEDSTIPKGSSVIVRRIPIAGTKSGMNCSKTRNIERTDVWQQQRFHGSDKAMADQTSTSDLFFSEMADPNVSEEDKIKALIRHQSTYDFMNYNCGSTLPANYTCYRCGNTGHHIKNCPYNKDKNADTPVRIKKSSGIPRSFLVEVDDPNMKGAMLTNSGRFAIPAIDAEAYAVVKKEKRAFVPAEPEEPEDEQDPVPEVLRCLICRDLLSDAVVIPCCANSYCDDCIRSALLDSEEHVCPTCYTPEVSPDTLIANKFLRQAVDNYKKELGGTTSQKKGSSSSILQHLNLTESPTLTLTKFIQSQALNPHKPIKSQQAADAWISSQECETPPAAAGSASASNTPSRSPETVQLHPEIPEESNEKRQDDSAAASPSGLVSNTSTPSQPQVDPPQAVVVNQQESSSGSLSESTPQQLLPPSSSSSSYPSTPPPIFPPSHFHPFPPLSGYPPGYPPATPVWTFPTLKGAPISSLCSSSSNPSLMPNEWYKNQREERSPHRGSSYRRSSEFSKSSHSYPSSRSRSRSRSRSKSRSRYRYSSKSSRSMSSHSYPSSKSRSRSRSRPKDRSGPHSPSSRHRDQHIRPRSSQSYSYGYKRSHSPTTSSSSSPRAGHHSRHKSPSGHRHHRKKSATSSSRSKRGGREHYHREHRGSTESSASYMFPQYADQMSSLELDRQRYLQWREEYKKWCEKYLHSYMEHFNQLPPLPPCPFSPSGGKEKSRTHSHDQHQGRSSSRTHSQTSSDSCSLSYQSSSDSSSKSSPSSSDVSSSPSHSSKNSRSPPSQSSSDSRSAHSEGGAQVIHDSARADAQREESEEAGVQEGKQDGNQLIVKTLEDLSPQEHERQGLKHHTQRAGEGSDAADFMGNKSHAAAETDSFNVDSKVDNTSCKEALKPVQQPPITDQCSDRGCERKSGELREVDGEKERRRDAHSDSRQDLEIKHKEKSGRKTHRRDRDRHRDPKASDSRSEKNKKRKEDDTQRSPDDGQSSQWLKTKTEKPPETLQEEHLCPSEKNSWPLMKKSIWEEGMKVKPQKKISINIKLDVKPKEDETKKQDQSALNNETEQRVDVSEESKVNRGETETHENKDSCRDQGGVLVEKIKSEAETGLMLEEYTLREEKGEIVTEKDDFQLWQCVPKGDEEEGSKNRWVDENRTEACKGEEVLNDQRRNAREEKEEDKSKRNDCRGEEKRGLVLIAQQEEMTAEEKRTNLPEKSETKETLNNSVSSSSRSSEECQEKQRAVNTLESCTDVRSAEDELIQVPRSKWEKEESEEEEFLPSRSVSVTAETTTNRDIEEGKEEQRQRSVKIERYKEERGRERHFSSSHRGLAPSSGRDRPDSSSYADRKKENGRESERQRDRDKESKVRTREGEKEKDNKRERGHKRSFPSSSHSMSHDTKRRDRSPKSSSRLGREFSSGKSSTSDQNANRADRNTSRSRDGLSSSRERDCSRSSGGSEPRKARRSSPAQELTQNRSRHESRVETGGWKEERMHRIRKEKTEHRGWWPKEKVDEKVGHKSGAGGRASQQRPSSRSKSSSPNQESGVRVKEEAK